MRAAARAFAAAGIDSAAVEARLLMSYALAAAAGPGEPAAAGPGEGTAPVGRGAPAAPLVPVGMSDVVLRGDDPVPGCWADWVARRVGREPLQHIVGSAPFCGVDLAVGPGVFVPRPETELLVAWAVERVTEMLRDGRRPVRVLDLCSGPGTIALGLAHLLGDVVGAAGGGVGGAGRAGRDVVGAAGADRGAGGAGGAGRDGATTAPAVEITGLELSATAVRLAEASHAALRERALVPAGVTVSFTRADLRERGVVPGPGLVGTADVVLSNPPYVPSGTPVSPEVRADPPEAVFAGADGMAFLPTLLDAALAAAAPGAWIAVEHDDATGPRTAAALAEAGVEGVRGHTDLSGRDRFVTGRVGTGARGLE
ncbi:peptide chain release factor N(5)-glutamine methyltransferase [Corynebacterium bovis]|uniref:N5-glutamine methyltransferase family protein n=1 Tax=Corynebacterium bovis TaxID=36808 RepID=UPI00254E234D|nr:peptide chain release factor N(5)-glutamine methyltransferase [Corynebacterium bovis]MDK8510695.1 peptide chain release factor N(5)-glutamine methyltransferase [Corynebacterium bovis]